MLLAFSTLKSDQTNLDPRFARNASNSGNTLATLLLLELLGINHCIPRVEFNSDHNETHQPCMQGQSSLQCAHNLTRINCPFPWRADRANLLVHIDTSNL